MKNAPKFLDYIPIPLSMRRFVEKLSPDQRGQLLLAIYDYAASFDFDRLEGEYPQGLDEYIDAVFEQVKECIDSRFENAARTSQMNAEKGRKARKSSRGGNEGLTGVPATSEQIFDFFRRNGWSQEQAERYIRYRTQQGWRNSLGQPITAADWLSDANAWHRIEGPASAAAANRG